MVGVFMMIGSMWASSVARVEVLSWSMASSRPSRVAASRKRCAVCGRWPTAVNISGRVSTSFTGRFTIRAASTVKSVCGQVRSPAPNPPPRYGTSTRTFSSGTEKNVARVVRACVGHWVDSCTVSRPPCQCATVANSPSGLLVSAAMANSWS